MAVKGGWVKGTMPCIKSPHHEFGPWQIWALMTNSVHLFVSAYVLDAVYYEEKGTIQEMIAGLAQ